MNRKQRRAAEKGDKFAGNRGGQSSQLRGLTAMQMTPEPTSEEIDQLVNMMRQGRYPAAETLAKNIIRRFPEYGLCWKVMGTSLILQGRTAEALAPMQKAASLLPIDPDIHSNLGVILYDLGRFDEAEACYRRALEIRPDYANGHNNLGNTLRKLARQDEAETCFRRALVIKPDLAEAQCNLGLTLQDLGRLDEAEACFRRALEIRSDFAEAYRNLGNIHKDLSRLDEALTDYRAALKYSGDWKDALFRLTNPLLDQPDLVLGPKYPVVNLTENREQTSNLRVQENILQTPSVSLLSDQELHVPAPKFWFNRFRKLLRKSERSAERHESSSHTDVAEHPESGIGKKLRIILIYPPFWQIPSPEQIPALGMPFGPPTNIDERKRYSDVDAEMRIITYGLLSIAAQAKRAGHNVSVYNLIACSWEDIVSLIAETEADVYGISAFNTNRRGMGAVSALIRQHHPQAHITVGGHFATSLPIDTLRYYPDIDTVVIGEGEDTFMDLLDRLGSGRPAVGIPGTAWRDGEEVTMGPPRPHIKDIDVLASPFDYFTNNIVMTSRGCPSKCSFCGSFSMWGRKLRFHSVESTLDILKKALERLSVPLISIMDDTFTTDRQRAIAICDAIIENKINFLWSCHTRVDCFDDELARKMRLAGCQSINFGVESGSPEILKNLRKNTTPEMVLKATRAAQKYGMHVGYYMILISRGETAETIQQSIELIKAGRPNGYVFSPLCFFPGTEDWESLCEKQALTPDIFFRNDFTELSAINGRHKEFEIVLQHVQCEIGAIYGFNYTLEEREAIVDRLPDLHCVHVELAHIYYRAGRFDEATLALNRAEELGFPISKIIYNLRASICLARNEIGKALALLEHACQYPDRIVVGNYRKLKDWVDSPESSRGKAPVLSDSIEALDYLSQESENTGFITM